MKEYGGDEKVNQRVAGSRRRSDASASAAISRNVMTQQDFLDASRKGDTVRNLVKRERMREQRASSTDDVELECAEDNRKSA